MNVRNTMNAAGLMLIGVILLLLGLASACAASDSLALHARILLGFVAGVLCASGLYSLYSASCYDVFDVGPSAK